MTPQQIKKIRELNDRFRQHIPNVLDVPGRVMLTRGIQQLAGTEAEPMCHLAELFELVRSYDDFSSANDPYAEHDFGSFEFQGEVCFWKVGIYDKRYEFGAEKPWDAHASRRVITIMTASEY